MKTGEQSVLDESGQLKSQNELKTFALGHIPDDPEQKHKVYYAGIEKLLKRVLPKGDRYKLVREYIREDKNIFLNRGKNLMRRE